MLKLKLEQQRVKLKESFMKCKNAAVVKVVSKFRISYKRRNSAATVKKKEVVRPFFVQRTEVNLRHFHEGKQRPLISRDDYYNGKFDIFARNIRFEDGKVQLRGHSQEFLVERNKEEGDVIL